ncbi:MAG TPA: cyclic nucleotide-binding domain-containing protein [Aeromonadales bacterium]|nr:cyclic nucleotide-binding domain-containing protein [Aeromonadales bacterium]
MQRPVISATELRLFSLFDGVSNDEIKSITSYIHIRNYPQKTQIITESDPSQCLYFILSGSVKVFLDDNNGKEIIVNQHHKHEFFGELGLMQNIPRTASVVTSTETRLGIMTAQDFKNCLFNHPALAMNLINNLVTRLINATETIRQLGLMDVYGRIAVTFFNMSVEKGDIRVINEKLTQQSIASLVGASREMVARILKDLKTGGYITIDKGIISILKPLPQNW